MATPRKLEPGRKVDSIDDFDTLITPNRFSGPLDIEWDPPFFFFHHPGAVGRQWSRPKHAGFVQAMQFWYLRNEIKAGRLYVARPRAKEAQ